MPVSVIHAHNGAYGNTTTHELTWFNQFWVLAKVLAPWWETWLAVDWSVTGGTKLITAALSTPGTSKSPSTTSMHVKPVQPIVGAHTDTTEQHTWHQHGLARIRYLHNRALRVLRHAL